MFIHFVRSITLLATLLVVPGIAIFWNHLPKDLVHQWGRKWNSNTEPMQFSHEDSAESATPVSVLVPEPVYPSLQDTFPTPAILPPTPKVASEVPLQQSIQQAAWEPARATASPQNFDPLELRLKALGATYYRLEKWGNRGELFRFSCFVTPSEPHTYEKHFQAIGTDAVTTIRSVIAEIETWKNVCAAR